MTSSAWKNVVILILAVAVVVEAGLFWRQRKEAALASNAAIAEASKLKSSSAEELLKNERPLLESEARSLVVERVSRVQASPIAPASVEVPRPLSHLNALVEAKKLGFATRVTAITWTRKLNPKFAQLFELGDGERERLQRALDKAGAETDRLELQSATTSCADDGSVVVQVKSFPERGGAVYDQLMGAFADTLGPERNAAFVSLAADWVEHDFGGFGTREKTLKVTWQPEEKSYKISEDYRTHQMSGTSSSTMRTFEDIQRARPALAQVIPEDLRAKSAPATK